MKRIFDQSGPTRSHPVRLKNGPAYTRGRMATGFILSIFWAAAWLSACNGVPAPPPVLVEYPTPDGAVTPPTMLPSPAPATTTAPPATATSTALSAVSAPPGPLPSPTTSEPELFGQAREIEFEAWELLTALAWSPDGALLAAAAGNGLYIFDADTWVQRAYIPLDAYSPGLAFSPDGARLALGSRDGSLRLWSLSALLSGGSPDWTIDAHKKGTNRIAFSPDGRLLATGGNDGMIRLWDAGSAEIASEIIGGSFAIPDLAFSPDGSELAIANGNIVRLREVDGGRIAGTLYAEETLYSIAWEPGRRWLATGDTARTVTLWSVAEETILRRFSGHAGEDNRPTSLIWQVAFSPGGRLLASAGGDGRVILWDPEREEPLAVLPGHSGSATCLAFSPDGRWLASGGLDGVLRLWLLTSG